MDMTGENFPEEHRRWTLNEHLNVGCRKPISYLPVKTIEKVLGLTISDYRSKVEQLGNKSVVFSAKERCIESGAVYAYSDAALEAVLKAHADILNACHWPTSTDEFVRKIASEWLEEDAPVLPVIRAAFGDASAAKWLSCASA